MEVHAGGCYAAGKRRGPVPRDETRRLLTSGMHACTHCKPGAQLRIRRRRASTPPSCTGLRPRRPAGAEPAAATESAPGTATIRRARSHPRQPASGLPSRPLA
ncbi:DUF6233 domain-containing protein [Streptomyces mirabilis]|uniref:DUF6233 domain-containing protein n=1 Tax=Streptomyces mirabilis TaxID=68239 RepID=UPI003D9E734E